MLKACARALPSARHVAKHAVVANSASPVPAGQFGSVIATADADKDAQAVQTRLYRSHFVPKASAILAGTGYGAHRQTVFVFGQISRHDTA